MLKTDVTTKVPQIAFHLSSVPASSVSTDSWKPLGADLQLKPEKIWIGTNLNGSNTAVSSVSVVPSTVSTTTPPTITFNYVGALPGMGMGATSLKVVVALRPESGSAPPKDSTQRCVIVETLLGSMRAARGSNCN